MTFEEHNSFAFFPLQQYNLDIKDMQQPLLVSMPKKADQKRGQTDPILLVPELCRLTGEGYFSDVSSNVIPQQLAH